jgi:hypothetical protein
MLIRIALTCLVLVSCKSTGSLSTNTNQAAEFAAETYWIIVQFKNPEGLKRTLYRLDKFKIAMEGLSQSDNIYTFRLKAKPFEIDGIIDKLRLNADVQWAKMADN